MARAGAGVGRRDGGVGRCGGSGQAGLSGGACADLPGARNGGSRPPATEMWPVAVWIHSRRCVQRMQVVCPASRYLRLHASQVVR